MEDAKILDLYWARNEIAIEETDKAYGRNLFCLSDRILQNQEDSEENVSDTYMKTWSSVPPNRPKHFLAFLSKICRHLALDRLDWRKAAKRNAEIISLTQEMQACIPDTSHDRYADAREISAAMESFLKTLSKESRLIFLRRYLYVDTVAEISQRYGISESKVKMQLHRTRAKLSEHLKKEGICV